MNEQIEIANKLLIDIIVDDKISTIHQRRAFEFIRNNTKIPENNVDHLIPTTTINPIPTQKRYWFDENIYEE